MNDLRLHSKKGVNAHLTYCPRCRGEARELVLMGAHDKVYKCTSCGATIFGYVPGGPCPSCKTKYNRTPYEDSGFKFVRTVGDTERVPGALCEDCEEELSVFKDEVSKGGIYWKCPLGHQGAIKHTSDLARHVREKTSIAPPDPVGIEFTKEECPACRKESSDA